MISLIILENTVPPEVIGALILVTTWAAVSLLCFPQISGSIWSWIWRRL